MYRWIEYIKNLVVFLAYAKRQCNQNEGFTLALVHDLPLVEGFVQHLKVRIGDPQTHYEKSKIPFSYMLYMPIL